MAETNPIKASKKPMRKLSGNFHRFLGVMKKYFKTTLRNKPVYFWLFGYPLLFMTIFGVMLRGTTSSKYDIAIVNYDAKAWNGQKNGEIVDFASEFMVSLFDPNNPNSNLSETFVLKQGLTESAALLMLKTQSVDAVVIIPGNFSEVIYGGFGQPELIIHTLPDPVLKSIIPSVFQSIVNQYIMQLNQVDTVKIEVEVIGKTASGLDYQMAAVVLAGITVCVMNVSEHFALEKQKGQLQRLDTTPVPRYVQLLGGGAAQLVFSMVQGGILMLCLVAFGTKISPDANWGLAFLNVMVLALVCIGLGLIIAAVVKDGEAAGGLSWIIILPLQIFGNIISNMGDSTMSKIWPTYYASRAMRNILISGLGFIDVWQDLLTNLIFGIVFIVIGVVIFQKKSQV